MTSIFTDNQHYTDIANAIRSKLGVATTYTPSQMASAVASISGGAIIYEYDDALVTRSVSAYTNSTASYIASFAFYNNKILQHASFLNVLSVSDSAFWQCGVVDVYLPECTSVGNAAFSNCSSLEIIDAPKCTYIGVSAFFSCKSLYSVNLPLLSTVLGSAFYSCSALTSINFPNCSSIGNAAFFGCALLATVSLANCSFLSDYAFQNCVQLANISVPNLQIIHRNAFYGCTSLQTISLPKCTSMSTYAFSNCTNLTSLYLTEVSSVPTIASTTFSNTPISSYGRGSVYVPASLYQSFIVASVWRSISSRIVSVQ